MSYAVASLSISAGVPPPTKRAPSPNVNDYRRRVVAVIIAYLLGAIPSAYIITRLRTGKDIRQLGSGNVGAQNVYREVGLSAAIPVAIFDVGKGAAAVAVAAVAVAIWELSTPVFFVLAAGLAAVAGHMWPIYLKFTGGNGLSPAIGVLALLLPRELLIVLALMLLFTVISRNPVLSLNISLLALPVTAWFLEKSWLVVAFTIILLATMMLHFLPTARAALAQAGSKEKLLAELLRHHQTQKEGKTTTSN